MPQPPSSNATERPPAYSTGELRYLASSEDVVHLADLLLRRTSIAFRGEATPDVVAEIADAVAGVLGWDEDAATAEVAAALVAVHAADPTWQPAAAPVA